MPALLSQSVVDAPFLAMLTAANESQVPRVLQTYPEHLMPISPRGAARSLRRLASAYVWAQSQYYHDSALVGPMQELVAALAAAQHGDGTYDQGNIHSPPDSSFTLQDLCMIWTLLHEDGSLAQHQISDTLQQIICKAAPMLAVGGVHTPNHRWEVCAALARINHLWPQPGYVERIEDWLDEGIDMDADGLYSERSAIYASGVTNPGLLTIARLLGKQELLDHVRRNLEATLYLLEPNGEVETVHSRRQDQKYIRDIWSYLLQYRELALRDGNGQFAHVARMIERRGAGELGDFLADVLERPELGAPLPTETAPPDHYTRVFHVSGLARVRHGNTTASIFGGTDYHAIPVIASGLSTNPTFFNMRRGAAILASVRMVPQFFNTGHFRSHGLEVEGTTYRLNSEVSVPYHQPLPREHRRRDGDYALSNDGRFYSQMDFARRQKQFRVLRATIRVSEAGSGFDLDIALEESEVSFTIELCFRSGGTLHGVQQIDGDDNYQLVEGFGSYTVGDDRITFGPGNGAGPLQPVNMEPGERYTYLGGSLVPDGVRVYITGRAPVRYVLQLR
ncbi:MAG TPA: hypothetical protein VFT66_06830 [Roseiflexaceae bacterium]|nr:hypothetical protein [Roseiflexaceae bacterium]